MVGRMAIADTLQATPLFERLRPYQREGASFLLHRSSALLADEMGLGKTVQAAIALEALRHTHRRVLLVAPAALCLNWVRELEKWAGSLVVRRVVGDAQSRRLTYRLPIQVLISSYEQLRIDIDSIASSIEFDLVILDEVQRIKNLDSTTSLACRRIRRKSSWGLSGTPLENSVDDLLSIFRFLAPQLLHSAMSRDEIHVAMQDHFLRRTKAEVLTELPPIIFRDIRLELGARQRQAYESVWSERYNDLNQQPGSRRTASMLALLTHLKQICNFDAATDESAKWDALHGILDSIDQAGGKVLLFSQYVETLKWLSKRLAMNHELFHGGLSADHREQMIGRFRHRPGPRAMLVSLKAGGVGLNLQDASTVILFDRWWNPAVEDQAVQRAHRFGRQTPVEVIRFVVEDTVEERIAEILDYKTTVFKEYIEEAPTVAAERLSDQDLRRILGLDWEEFQLNA